MTIICVKVLSQRKRKKLKVMKNRSLSIEIKEFNYESFCQPFHNIYYFPTLGKLLNIVYYTILKQTQLVKIHL